MSIDARGGENLDVRRDENTLGHLYHPAYMSSMLLKPNQKPGHMV